MSRFRCSSRRSFLNSLIREIEVHCVEDFVRERLYNEGVEDNDRKRFNEQKHYVRFSFWFIFLFVVLDLTTPYLPNCSNHLNNYWINSSII